jgi:hypothetical protein
VSEPHPELLILVIVLVALALAPLASRLVERMGEEISAELDGGRTGEALTNHLDRSYEERTTGSGLRDDEIHQMIEAQAFLRGESVPPADGEVRRILAREDPGLRDEVRQLVIASNERRARVGEPPRDVEEEVDRRLARLLGTG